MASDARTMEGWINYMSPTLQSSLYRNGAVYTNRDLHGSDDVFRGVKYDRRKISFTDGRQVSTHDELTLLRNGFELRPHEISPKNINFLSYEDITRKYYGECTKLVGEALEATHVFAFDHNVRSAGGNQTHMHIDKGQAVQSPVAIVHGDYTLTSAHDRLQKLTEPPGENDTFRDLLKDDEPLIKPELAAPALAGKSRFCIVNVWRNIKDYPIQKRPLGVCNARTVNPAQFVVFEVHYKDRIGENYFAKYAQPHQWYYFSDMSRDEALVFKTWDSAGTFAATKGAQADGDQDSPCSLTLHTAVEQSAEEEDGKLDRWSIEVRCMALF